MNTRPNSRTIPLAAGLALSLAFAAPAAQAHHSFAMFDRDKVLTLDATVKAFQWTNPHSWIQLNVPDATGKPVEWSIEWGGVSGLYKQGVRATSLKTGDKITVLANPLKNGNPGGMARKITGADGQQIGGRQG